MQNILVEKANRFHSQIHLYLNMRRKEDDSFGVTEEEKKKRAKLDFYVKRMSAELHEFIRELE